MNKAQINLTQLLDIVRKDSGINNAIGAMEQLSLLLLVKYFYQIAFSDVSNKALKISFKEFILKSNFITDGVFELNVFTLNIVFSNIAFSSEKRLTGLYGGGINSKVLSKVGVLIEAIPFRIRSIKILEILLSRLEAIEFNDSLAEAYDELIIKMIDDSIASGAFYNQKSLVSAIVRTINPAPMQSIYDPALGTGRFIVESKKLIFNVHGNEFGDQLCVFGRDISPTACLIGTLNLLLNGIDVENISIGDSLLDDSDLTYDIILSGIPFGKLRSVDQYEKEYPSSLEAMFLKLAMKKLAKDGKAALIVPNGLLFSRSNDLNNLRRQLLTDFNLHSILSLPAGAMAPFSRVQVSVLFFEKTIPGDDIWFYRLTADKFLGKDGSVDQIDFTDFCELFSKRTLTENSYLINKSGVLSGECCVLSFDIPEVDVNKKEYHIIDELSALRDGKKIIDELWSSLTESLILRHEVGVIKKTTLGDIFTLSAGKVLGKAYIVNEGKYPVYGANGIIGYYDQCNRMGENVVIGRVGANCGNIHVVNGSIWLTDNSFSVQIRDSLPVYLPYLAHALRSLDLRKLARGSAQPSISYAMIKDIEIGLPSYEMQLELSKWFDEIQVKNDELQKLIQLQRDKFDELANFSIASNCGEMVSN